MFSVGQILTPTKLIKNFGKIARHVAAYPQALLVLQRNGKHLVLMDAELFDEMMRRASSRPGDLPQNTGLVDELEFDS